MSALRNALDGQRRWRGPRTAGPSAHTHKRLPDTMCLSAAGHGHRCVREAALPKRRPEAFRRVAGEESGT